MARSCARRSALRGTEQRIINLVFNMATPRQCEIWLRAPLECAILKGDLQTTLALLRAGATPRGEAQTARLADLLLAHPTWTDKRGDAVLHTAVLVKHDSLVEMLLSKGADRDAFDRDGRSPLRLAIEHSSISAVKALLAAGADSSLRCVDDGCAALDVATIHSELEIMAMLITAGNNVNGACVRGYTALHRGAFHNNLQALELLLQAGAYVDATDRLGWTPLFDACAQGSTDVIVSLLRHGANRRHLDKGGRGLLHIAAERGHLPSVKVLLRHGRIDVDLRYGSSQCSALDFASIGGHADVMRALIELGGAEVNGSMADGRTTAHRAAFFNQPGAIDQLFRAGANLEAKTNDNCSSGCSGWTPIFDAAAEGSAEAVVALLRHKASHNVRDSNGRSPLHVAVEADHTNVCSALLAGGANPFLRYGGGELSALDVAVCEGNLDIVADIIRFWPTGLSSADSRGYTALHHAASRNEVGIISALSKAGAAVDATDSGGWTPLFEGCAQGSSDAVAALLENGANAEALDSEGRSALHLAVQRGFLGPTVHLLAAGADVGRRIGKSESSALDLAVAEGHLDILREIVANRAADLNATDSAGRTALHRGAFFNHATALDLLVKVGASTGVLDSQGRTPLDVAISRGSTEAATVLSADMTTRDPTLARRRWHRTSCVPVVHRSPAVAAKPVRLMKNIGEPTPAKKKVRFGDGSPDRSLKYVEFLNKRVETAPADRAWRRRGFLVMCRAYPGRVRLLLDLEAGFGSGGATCAPPAAVGPFSKERTMETPGDEEGVSHGSGRRCEESSAKTSCLPWPAMEGSAKTRRLEAVVSARWLCAGGGGGGGGSDIARLMARVMVLQEDGLFRNIVGFV